MITEFRGSTKWLSNYEICEVQYEGETYISSEHAYQAAKSLIHKERVAVKLCDTPAKAKKLGNSLTIRPDWDSVKLLVMYEILMDKFTRNMHLKALLLDTGDEELVEGNTWGDTFWGVSGGIGHNYLGKILMEVRRKIRAVG